jgi:hypothetical protein
MRGVRVHRTAPRCTRIHGFRAAAIFYPNFYPKRRRSGIEMSYPLITAANRSGQPELVTSLPSWSCGFDSRRPLFGFLPWSEAFSLGLGDLQEARIRPRARCVPDRFGRLSVFLAFVSSLPMPAAIARHPDDTAAASRHQPSHGAALPCPALDAEPGECALVGDSVTDIQGARLVSVQSIGYANEPANANTSPQPEQAPLSTASRT